MGERRPLSEVASTSLFLLLFIEVFACSATGMTNFMAKSISPSFPEKTMCSDVKTVMLREGDGG
jgi:hypothetical protein